MTDEQIIKALECCRSWGVPHCSECAYKSAVDSNDIDNLVKEMTEVQE